MKTKNNNLLLIITSVICLLPIILSLVLYNDLPDQIAIHWNSAGEPNNYVHKGIAAFGLPFMFLLINLMLTRNRKLADLKNKSQSKANASWQIYLWAAPAVSIISVPITLLIAMGVNIPITMIASLLVGGILIICGNYLPKSRQNDFMGIKLPWTLRDTDNWNKTHHMAGYLWIVGGFIIIITTFLAFKQIILGVSVTAFVAILLAIVPMLYSYSLYRKSNS